MTEPRDRVEVECPCCATKLVVATANGEVLAEERPKRDADATFEDAMKTVQSSAARREAAFSKAVTRTRGLDDVLEKKFEEARKKAAKDESPRLNPLDFD